MKKAKVRSSAEASRRATQRLLRRMYTDELARRPSKTPGAVALAVVVPAAADVASSELKVNPIA